jgi:hypothetical protein
MKLVDKKISLLELKQMAKKAKKMFIKLIRNNLEIFLTILI